MRYSISIALQIFCSVCIHTTSAQRLTYSTFAVTECITKTDSLPDAQVVRPVGPIIKTASSAQKDSALTTLSYSMPPCISGDCPDCTILSSFTTAYLAFETAGAVGTKTQSYVITETYVGLSSLPPFEKPTPLPYGFVTGVETCNLGVCGPEAITATITYPAGNKPTPAHGSGCSPGGGIECSTLSTRTGTLNAPAAPVLAPALPTAVIAGGNILRGPFEIVIVFVLLIAAP
ncbi:hypothetical protein F4803DRAFT_550865 [Xylaria telfairii]|nr:hypothetical protein F4803DRAFT_550865 [Xylaria telfairii]